MEDSGNSLFTLFFITAVCVMGTRGGTLQAQVYCFDRPTVYADGVLIGNNTGTDHYWTGEVADDTKLLAVKCYNVDGDDGAGYCGFLAYIVDILASDTILSAWKCTDNITKADNDRWYDLDFDDSGWDVPRTSSSNYGGYRPTVKYGTVTQTDKVYVNTIPKPIEFLTTASSRPDVDLQAAYCRGNTGLVIYIQCEKFCTVPIGSTSHSVFSPSFAWSYTFPRATRVFGVRGVRGSSDRPYIAILGSFGIKTSTKWRCINDSSLESEFGRGKPTDRNDSGWQVPVDQGPISLSEEIQGATPIWATGNDIVCVFDVECGCDYKCDVNGDDFKCLCPDGYVLNVDKRTCRDVNECSEKNENLPLHDCDQRCINIPGSYDCQCFDGYEPVDDKNRTCNDIDECATQTDKCLDLFQCVNTNGSYRCVCPSGYHENTEVEKCVDNDECNPQTIYFSRHQCEHTCTNTPGSYTCLCNEGYVLQVDGKTCAKLATSCSETYMAGLIASVAVNIILVILVVVMGIIILRRCRPLCPVVNNQPDILKARNRPPQTQTQMSPTMTGCQSTAGPNESLEQTAQNANADVDHYDRLSIISRPS